METIEEAWAWLDEKCGERMKLHKPAARALALAVLEDVRDVAAEFTSEAHRHDEGDCDFCVNVALVRARIERLGG